MPNIIADAAYRTLYSDWLPKLLLSDSPDVYDAGRSIVTDAADDLYNEIQRLDESLKGWNATERACSGPGFTPHGQQLHYEPGAHVFRLGGVRLFNGDTVSMLLPGGWTETGSFELRLMPDGATRPFFSCAIPGTQEDALIAIPSGAYLDLPPGHIDDEQHLPPEFLDECL